MQINQENVTWSSQEPCYNFAIDSKSAILVGLQDDGTRTFALSTKDGSLLWSKNMPNCEKCNFALSPSSSIIYATSNLLTALSLDGKLLWNVTTQNDSLITSGPVISNRNFVYVYSDCKIDTYEFLNGTYVWSAKIQETQLCSDCRLYHTSSISLTADGVYLLCSSAIVALWTPPSYLKQDATIVGLVSGLAVLFTITFVASYHNTRSQEQKRAWPYPGAAGEDDHSEDDRFITH